jgi:TRAP-type C4-dicarboxylate transport system substrate-binding protein
MKTSMRKLGAGLALWTAMVAAGGPAIAAPITWKATIWGPSRTTTEPFDWYAKEVAARTNGEMKIEFAYSKGKATEAVEVLTSGAADASYICSQYFADKMPLMMILDLPMFSPDSVLAIGRVAVALSDHPAIHAELKQQNVRLLVPAPLQQYQLMGTRKIIKLADLQGARVRISPDVGKSLAEFGATIHVMSPPDAIAALRNGALDAIGMPYPIGFALYDMQKGSTYITDNISLGAGFCYLGVSAKAWDALPAKTKKVMLGLREPAATQYEKVYARESATHIAAFKQQGLEFVSFNSVDRARLLAKTVKHWQVWVEEREKQGLKGREVFEFTRAKIREYTR